MLKNTSFNVILPDEGLYEDDFAKLGFNICSN